MQNRKYLSVTQKMAKKNPDYWKVLRIAFEEQATRVAQRLYRTQRNKVYKGKYTETLNGPLTLSFLKEPLLVKPALVYAEKINSGKWLELPFIDEEFERNLYKALRLALITSDQLGTALMIYYAQIEHKDEQRSHPHRQFHFDEPGPYDYKKIMYATQERIVDFKQQLNKLHPADQNYFTINFSRKLEVTFLYDGLFNGSIENSQYFTQRFYDFFHAYLLKLPLPLQDKRVAFDCLHRLKNPAALPAIYSFLQIIPASPALYLRNFLLTQEKEFSQFIQTCPKTDITRDGVSFASNIDHLLEQCPSVEISPDYDSNNPNSPLLCAIVPSLSALNTLNSAMLQHHDITTSYLIAGQFPTRVLRDLDENPHLYNLAQTARGVELSHPDLQSSPKAHEYLTQSHILMKHDLYHVTHNAANPFKTLLRYMRVVIEKETGLTMSTSIWTLTEMLLEEGKYLNKYLAEKNHNKVLALVATAIDLTVKRTLTNFSNCELAHQNNYILIIDALLHQDKWNNLTFHHPLLRELADTHPELTMPSYLTQFRQLLGARFISLEKIIAESSQEKSIKYYVLRMHLKTIIDGKDICDSLEEIGMNNIFSWKLNGSLTLNKQFSSDNKKIILEGFDLDKLSEILRKVVKIFKNKLLLTNLQPRQGKKLTALSHLIGTRNTLQKFNSGKFLVSTLWLKQVDKINPEGLDNFAKTINQKSEDIRAEIVKRTAPFSFS